MDPGSACPTLRRPLFGVESVIKFALNQERNAVIGIRDPKLCSSQSNIVDVGGNTAFSAIKRHGKRGLAGKPRVLPAFYCIR